VRGVTSAELLAVHCWQSVHDLKNSVACSAAQTKRTTGIFYLQLGSWPSWIGSVVLSASRNTRATFYFIGPAVNDSVPECTNCCWLPLTEELLFQRATDHLNVPLPTPFEYRKLCDLKPMWPALYPEITMLHEWVGYADSDIIFGDISSEIATLDEHPETELLVPLGFWPMILSQGMLSLFRSTPKMVHAYLRSDRWREVVMLPAYYGFDEYWSFEGVNMNSVYKSMMADGNLVGRSTGRLLLQDLAYKTGPFQGFTLSSFDASIRVLWQSGKTLATRSGPCLCPDGHLGPAEDFFTYCAACAEEADWQHPAVALRSLLQEQAGPDANATLVASSKVFSWMERQEEVLGFHFQIWKKGPSYNNGTDFQIRTPASWDEVESFAITPTGFDDYFAGPATANGDEISVTLAL